MRAAPALALMTGVGPGLSPGLTLPPTTQGGSAARVGPLGSGGVAGLEHRIGWKGLRTRRKRQVRWRGGEVAAAVLWSSRGQRAVAQSSREGELRLVPVVHAWMLAREWRMGRAQGAEGATGMGHMVWQRGAGSGVARESVREGLEPGGRAR